MDSSHPPPEHSRQTPSARQMDQTRSAQEPPTIVQPPHAVDQPSDPYTPLMFPETGKCVDKPNSLVSHAASKSFIPASKVPPTGYGIYIDDPRRKRQQTHAQDEWKKEELRHDLEQEIHNLSGPIEGTQTVSNASEDQAERVPKEERVAVTVSIPIEITTRSVPPECTTTDMLVNYRLEESIRPSSMDPPARINGEDPRHTLNVALATSPLVTGTSLRGPRQSQPRGELETGTQQFIGPRGSDHGSAGLGAITPAISRRKLELPSIGPDQVQMVKIPAPFIEEPREEESSDGFKPRKFHDAPPPDSDDLDDDLFPATMRRAHESSQSRHHGDGDSSSSDGQETLHRMRKKYRSSCEDTDGSERHLDDVQSSEYRLADLHTSHLDERMDDVSEEQGDEDRGLYDDVRIPEVKMLTLQKASSFSRKRTAVLREDAQSYIKRPRMEIKLTTEDVVLGLMKGNVHRQELLVEKRDMEVNMANIQKTLSETKRCLERANVRSNDYKNALNEKESKSDVKQLRAELVKKEREFAKREKDFQRASIRQAGEIDTKNDEIEKFMNLSRAWHEEFKNSEKEGKKLQAEIKALQKEAVKTFKEIESLRATVSTFEKRDVRKSKYLNLMTWRLASTYEMYKRGNMPPDDMAWELYSTKRAMGDHWVANLKHGMQISEDTLAICKVNAEGEKAEAPDVPIPSTVLPKRPKTKE